MLINKVKYIFVISLIAVALGLISFFMHQKSDTKDVENNDIVQKKPTKRTPKNKTKSISSHIIYEDNAEHDLGAPDASERPFYTKKSLTKSDQKNDPNKYRRRTISYSDPVNDRVLGDPKWAATTSKAEKELVEKAFETPPENPDIIRFSRQRSIDVIKPIVNKCYEELQQVQPTAKGRLIVEWLAGKDGKISDLKLGANVDLRFPSFTTCILDRTRNLTFNSNAEDIFVEYPFAFL